MFLTPQTPLENFALTWIKVCGRPCLLGPSFFLIWTTRVSRTLILVVVSSFYNTKALSETDYMVLVRHNLHIRKVRFDAYNFAKGSQNENVKML